MPCKIYECVLLIALVALREDGVCFGLKQGKSSGGIRRGDRTKAVFTSFMRSGGHHTSPPSLPNFSLTQELQSRQHQTFSPRLL